MIDITGNELHVVIECENNSLHSWMSFASWYSVVKNLPNAGVTIVCKRGKIPTVREHFMWARRAKVNFFIYENEYCVKTDKKIFKIPASVMAIRAYDAQLLGPVDVKTDVLATFVNYSEGCGKFVISEWINREVGLFREVSKFETAEMSINETKLLNLWNKSHKLYENLEGGGK
jgi:hypothetical protein